MSLGPRSTRTAGLSVEIVGVPDELIRLFSKRRAQVVAGAAGLIAEKELTLGRSLTGDERAAAYQLAAYRSRAAKGEGAETTDHLRARWRAEATKVGRPPQQWIGALAALSLDLRSKK